MNPLIIRTYPGQDVFWMIRGVLQMGTSAEDDEIRRKYNLRPDDEIVHKPDGRILVRRKATKWV